jgi:hypothetical protein
VPNPTDVNPTDEAVRNAFVTLHLCEGFFYDFRKERGTLYDRFTQCGKTYYSNAGDIHALKKKICISTPEKYSVSSASAVPVNQP